MRVETLGGKGQVRSHLSLMREDERDRCVRAKFGEEAVAVSQQAWRE
jgi:hypothetical protein